MIAVGVDIFSGRLNPSWLPSERDARALLKKIAANRDAIARPDSRPQRLGYRGVYVALLSDDVAASEKLPLHFMLGTGTTKNDELSFQLAAELVSNMGKYPDRRENGKHALKGKALQTLVTREVEEARRRHKSRAAQPARSTVSEDEGRLVKSLKRTACTYETGTFNPGFWNDCKECMANNNCYNYARNVRTDTFAQPGRASGAFPYQVSCANVKNGALSDGAHVRFDCFPDGESPRWLMALVVWPPTADYHWYRKHTEGFWGHKPGQTAARNVDNSNNVIFDPENCDRGNYTEFCGYFYAAKSMVIA